MLTLNTNCPVVRLRSIADHLDLSIIGRDARLDMLITDKLVDLLDGRTVQTEITGANAAELEKTYGRVLNLRIQEPTNPTIVVTTSTGEHVIAVTVPREEWGDVLFDHGGGSRVADESEVYEEPEGQR